MVYGALRNSGNDGNASNRSPVGDRSNPSRGFTLIELLTVISIIGILTAVVSVNLGSARKQARDVRRQTDLGTIQSALELEANANNGRVTGTNGALVTSNQANQPWITDPALASYLSTVPVDPLPGDTTFVYRYLTNASGTAYFIDAVLEVGKQADANLTSAPPLDASSSAFVTGKYWDPAASKLHYRVSSGGQ